MNINPGRESLSDRQLSSTSTNGSYVTLEPRWQKFLIPTLIFIWPFIYFFRYIIPFNCQYIGIGNDFNTLYYLYKVYLLDYLSNGKIPLWSPSEAGGFPFYSSPFTQTFYPLNFFLTIFYTLAGGYTRLDHQTFTVLGVSIYALGLYFWLRLLNLNLRSILFATFVMSVSFKIAEILRFPNAMHTAAWYPWLLFALTKIVQSQSMKEAVKYGFLLFIFFVCFLTGGYPYYVYYSIFLLGPYLLLFTVPKVRQKLFKNQIGKWKTSIGVLLVAGISSVVLVAPYLAKISQLSKETTDRSGGNFAYSTEHKFFLNDTLGSLIFPPFARAEGWYYFGILGVFIILLYLCSDLFGTYHSADKSVELEKQPLPWYQKRWVKILFLAWIVTITYITYGRYSYLFILLWKYMPLFSTLRTWGRLNIILVPIIAWLLAIAYSHFEDLIFRTNYPTKGFSKWKPIYVVTGAYVAILIIQSFIFKKKLYTGYWNEFFQNVAATDILFIIFGAIAFLITLTLLLVSPILVQSNKVKIALLVVLILFSALDTRNVGAFMWAYPSPLETPQRYRVNIAKQNLESFAVPRAGEDLSVSVSSTFNTKIVPNWHFNRYIKFLESTETQLDARIKLLGEVDGRKLYFSKAIAYPTIQPFLDDADRFQDFARVISYTGDELVLDVRATTEGYLSFIDNWDASWEATVDGKPTSIELLFGTFKSIRLPAGEHQVIFAYRPKLFSKAVQ